MYEIELSDKAKKQLRNLPTELQYRIGFAFEKIKINPFRSIKRKQGSPYFILRIGSYRAILNIIQKKLLILVLEIGPRKNIYKN
jgi:mRNA interferase RelE/StbE